MNKIILWIKKQFQPCGWFRSHADVVVEKGERMVGTGKYVGDQEICTKQTWSIYKCTKCGDIWIGYDD